MVRELPPHSFRQQDRAATRLHAFKNAPRREREDKCNQDSAGEEESTGPDLLWEGAGQLKGSYEEEVTLQDDAAGSRHNSSMPPLP